MNLPTCPIQSLPTCLALAVLVVASLLSLPACAEQSEPATKRDIVIGKVSDDPKKHYRSLKPMADYLASRMADLGIREGKVLMARDNQQMITYLRQGRVDIVTETIFSAVLFQNKSGAEILVKSWRKGTPYYHTVIFVRKDSDIRHLADLKGRKIAFEDPGSLSAYFVPASVLIKQGFTLVRLTSPRESPPLDQVGYVFSGEEINTSIWVDKKLVDAGALSNLDWASEDDMPANVRRNMRIVHKTDDLPRALEVVRKELAPALKQRIRELMLHAHDDPQAQEALRAYEKTSRFESLNTMDMKGIAEVKRMEALVQPHLE